MYKVIILLLCKILNDQQNCEWSQASHFSNIESMWELNFNNESNQEHEEWKKKQKSTLFIVSKKPFAFNSFYIYRYSIFMMDEERSNYLQCYEIWTFRIDFQRRQLNYTDAYCKVTIDLSLTCTLAEEQARGVGRDRMPPTARRFARVKSAATKRSTRTSRKDL